MKMTSAATRQSRPSSLLWPDGKRSAQPTGGAHGSLLPPSARHAGLTLIELMLALAIVLLLMGLVVVNLPAWGRSQRLDEGTDRFEALLSMARADAANLGRKLRLDFEISQRGTGYIRLLWEADPVAGPMQFTDYSACTWLHYVPTDLVEVVRCQVTASDTYVPTTNPQTSQADSAGPLLEPVTFYPDGSCDSAVIELTSTDGGDRRRSIIRIDGLTGRVTSRILGPSEQEDLSEG